MSETRADSEVSICNLALSLLPHAPIISLDQPNSKAARRCKQHYALQRDGLLREYRWNFSTEWRSLGASGAVPVAGFSYAYNLPADALGVFEVDGAQDEQWAVERIGTTSQLTCDLTAPISAMVSILVTEPAKYDAHFVGLLSHRMAAVLSPSLTRSRELSQDVQDDMAELEKRAKQLDARQARKNEPPVVSRWLAARRIS